MKYAYSEEEIYFILRSVKDNRISWIDSIIDGKKQEVWRPVNGSIVALIRGVRDRFSLGLRESKAMVDYVLSLFCFRGYDVIAEQPQIILMPIAESVLSIIEKDIPPVELDAQAIHEQRMEATIASLQSENTALRFKLVTVQDLVRRLNETVKD